MKISTVEPRPHWPCETEIRLLLFMRSYEMIRAGQLSKLAKQWHPAGKLGVASTRRYIRLLRENDFISEDGMYAGDIAWSVTPLGSCFAQTVLECDLLHPLEKETE
jgi:hypothetical protein